MLSTEFQLAVECCRRRFADATDRPLTRLSSQADWPRFLRIVRRHRVQALVWQSLRELDLAVPPGIAGELSADAARIAETNLRAAALSAELVEAFGGAGIDLLFVKGLTVGKLAYGQAFLKMSQDIDLLVARRDIPAAAAELERLGCRPTTPAVSPQSPRFERWHRTRKESVWRSPGGLLIELHGRLAGSRALIPGVGMHSPRQPVEVAPGIVLPTLARDELFAYLCVHGASSAWFRLKWITDLAALLEQCAASEIARLYDRSQQLGAGRAAAQALLLAARVYGIGAGSELDRQLSCRPVHRRLAKAAWNQLLRDKEPTEYRGGTAMIHWTQLFLLPGARFKLREVARQIAEAAA